jgi:acid phosphatase type 7
VAASRSRFIPNILLFTLLLASACTGPTSPSSTPPIEVATWAGAGDIADCTALGPAEETARLLDTIEGTIFTAGDHAYYYGSADDFARCYQPTWGRHKSRTWASPGNHDYATPGAADYFTYFGDRAGPAQRGFYSYDLAGWKIFSLNSNIPAGESSDQYRWLEEQLAALPRPSCTAAYWHHPVTSSGPHGDQSVMASIWRLLYRFGTEIVVAGHDHDYERFTKLNAELLPDSVRGIRQFIVGTGGAPLYSFVSIKPGSEVRITEHGVMRFTLRTGSYDWEFLPIRSTSQSDTGTDVCQ